LTDRRPVKGGAGAVRLKTSGALRLRSGQAQGGRYIAGGTPTLRGAGKMPALPGAGRMPTLPGAGRMPTLPGRVPTVRYVST